MMRGMIWHFISPQFPFIISIFVELSLIPLYLVTVNFLMLHLAETYNIEKENKDNN
ncbi:MAG: hypothetical protein ACFFB0_00460 [Promethearchaeota archaeon]